MHRFYFTKPIRCLFLPYPPKWPQTRDISGMKIQATFENYSGGPTQVLLIGKWFPQDGQAVQDRADCG